jgi:hypothetical protein
MRILGVYDEPAKAAVAVATAQDAGLTRVDAFSPAPDHTLEQLMGARVSPVRLFTLLGAVLGCTAGFALPIYTVSSWPLITGGKPLISIPAFVVIAFELTILFGAIFGMLGFLVLARLPRLARKPLSDPRFSNNCFGVEITCDEPLAAAARTLLADAGAIEVRTDD